MIDSLKQWLAVLAIRSEERGLDYHRDINVTNILGSSMYLNFYLEVTTHVCY